MRYLLYREKEHSFSLLSKGEYRAWWKVLSRDVYRIAGSLQSKHISVIVEHHHLSRAPAAK